MTTAANWLVMSPRTGDAEAERAGPSRPTGAIVSSARVSGGSRTSLPAGWTRTQNCPPADPSSVVSGSVQIETTYGPAGRSETIGKGGPLCASSVGELATIAITNVIARRDAFTR